nr:uncharacterized protein LOC105328252 [Crassostrea gigas]
MEAMCSDLTRSISKLTSEETEKNRKSLIKNGCLSGTYVTTVFLLDTSGSMAGTGLEQMKTAFKDIIYEFSKHPSVSENVMVVTFGRDVKVIQHYSNKHKTISRCVDGLECEGGSPLQEGIVLSTSGISSAPYSMIGSFHVRTRIVIITDGKPTGTDEGYNLGRPNSLTEFREPVMNEVRMIGKSNPIFCIPVGNDPDICFLGTLVSESGGGKLIPCHEARQFGRYALNIDLASKVLERLPVEDHFSNEAIRMAVSRLHTATEMDLEDVCEIISKQHVYRSNSCIVIEMTNEQEDEFQERNQHMPTVGTRVRRGPDWEWKNQDGQGAGTVVGHSKRVGWINVEWDTGLTMSYRYGNNGMITAYDIEPCDEPRILEDQPIAVGCLVRRGPDWKWDNQDGGEGNIGRVYRLKKPTEIYVRWHNGHKSNYRYGYKNRYDVELCDPFDGRIKELLRRQAHRTPLTDGHKSSLRTSSNCSNDSMQREKRLPPGLKVTQTESERTSEICYKRKSYFKNSNKTSRKWQWRGLDNKWFDFPKNANEVIEHCSKGKGATVIVNLNGQLCRINLKKETMVNTITKEVTDVRILEKPITPTAHDVLDVSNFIL